LEIRPTVNASAWGCEIVVRRVHVIDKLCLYSHKFARDVGVRGGGRSRDCCKSYKVVPIFYKLPKEPNITMAMHIDTNTEYSTVGVSRASPICHCQVRL
jgi:hypothetical protein